MISKDKLSKIFNSSEFYASLVAIAMLGAAVAANYTFSAAPQSNTSHTSSGQKLSGPSR